MKYPNSICGNGDGSKYLSEEPSTQPCGQVDGEISHLNNSSERLSRIVSDLEARLRAVVRQQPCDPSGNVAPEACLVPLAAEVRALRQSFDRSANRLEDLLSLIEL